MARQHIILGMGYGDEGKGVFTDYLASKLESPVVIRFNGGHQCGHTVRHSRGHMHVFSNFGAGSFRQIPTFFSRFCTIDPMGILREYKALQSLGVKPVLFVDPLAMVTTPFDKLYNINDESNRVHGTVGVGFGATVERNQATHKLFVQDLFFPAILRRKIEAVRDYYRAKLKAGGIDSCLAALELEMMRIGQFLYEAEVCRDIIQLVTEKQLFAMRFANHIFEGGQGILLDMDFGIFPNVTRSNTTGKNAFEMLCRNGIATDTTVYYLTRAYQTRHGNGWMSSEKYPVTLVNNEHETNGPGGHQGEFRTGMLDTDMLRYALQCDASFSGEAEKQMVISCMDQLTSYRYLSAGNVLLSPDRDSFLKQIALCDTVLTNDGPGPGTIQRWR
jgi:adenylosuccinate synthase